MSPLESIKRERCGKRENENAEGSWKSQECERTSFGEPFLPARITTMSFFSPFPASRGHPENSPVAGANSRGRTATRP